MVIRTPVILAVAFAASLAAAVAANPPNANGKAIFQTGRDLAGTAVGEAQKPPQPACAVCHRANGAGGLKLAGGAVSADLRQANLVTHQKHPYTQALLERAIATGIDNDGKKLDRVMPRWHMSKRDLHDVAQYVLSGLK
jgi:mono/diheme cytochrome c family protein